MSIQSRSPPRPRTRRPESPMPTAASPQTEPPPSSPALLRPAAKIRLSKKARSQTLHKRHDLPSHRLRHRAPGRHAVLQAPVFQEPENLAVRRFLHAVGAQAWLFPAPGSVVAVAFRAVI